MDEIIDLGINSLGEAAMSMLWVDGFGSNDINQRVPPREPVTERSMELRDLQAQVERLTLLNQAMWELIRDRLQLSDHDLAQVAQQIDLRDGIEDAKMSRIAVSCPSCKRVCNSRHAKCMYCGQLFEKPVFG